ncbi:MAG: PilZ domain-containing protein [Methylovulum sp.]|jgi:hypothetical protein|nr:PilZ domain-containing protein [Methylovulum sp.]MCF7997733.1 PilZ domain-containing protein [Methylovulum sp.]
MTNNDDRRKHARNNIEVEYRFLLDGAEYHGLTSNISLSGAFLSRPEPELSPSCVSEFGILSFTLNETELVLKSEIVYVAAHDNEMLPVGAGVAFCDTDEETGQSILMLANLLLDY